VKRAIQVNRSAGTPGVPGAATTYRYVSAQGPGGTAVRAFCDPGEKVTGGGGSTTANGSGLIQNHPISDASGTIAFGTTLTDRAPTTSVTCTADGGSIGYSASGLAAGPYPGSFTETGTATVSPIAGSPPNDSCDAEADVSRIVSRSAICCLLRRDYG
jgi:hypothetical protein